jgi:hypothetical protein
MHSQCSQEAPADVGAIPTIICSSFQPSVDESTLSESASRLEMSTGFRGLDIPRG